jgi:type I restriction enzyme M protein
MGDPGTSAGKDAAQTAKSEAILTELFGPLADRVRGAGSRAAYINLLLCSVFLRHCARSTWADVREHVRDSLDAQSEPQELLRLIGGRTDAALREHRLPQGISAALDDLRGDAIDDLAHVLRLCEDLGPKDLPVLLDRFGAELGTQDGSFFTPRSVVELVVQMLRGSLSEDAWIHDPYVRGGELLVGALKTGGRISLSGASPSSDMLRLAGMNLLLSGGQADLYSGTNTPWNQPGTQRADLVLTNPPFNSKGSYPVKIREESWIFGPPPGHKHNYAWLQHVVATLKPAGRAIVLMPNQAAVSIDAREQFIRERMIREGAVEFMVALPRQLFAATRVSAMIWGLCSPSERPGSVLFIDIRQAGSKQGKQRILTTTEVRAVAECLHSWRAGADDFASVMRGIGKATAASIKDIENQDYSLDPADYLSKSLLDVGYEAIAAMPDIAATVELRTREARMADEKAARIVVQRRIDGDSQHGYWRRTYLGKICKIQAGPSHSIVKKGIHAEDGVPLVVPSSLRDHRILANEAERINVEVARKMKGFQLSENDILFVRTGSVGPVALVTAPEEGWLFGTALIRLRCGENVNPGYLLAFLSSRPAQTWVQVRTESATAIPSISTGSLGKLPVSLPPLDEQKRVSDLLDKVDTQVAVHRTLADTAKDLRTLLTDGLTSGLLIAN